MRNKKIRKENEFAFPTTYFNVDGDPDKSSTVPGLRKVEYGAFVAAAEMSSVLDEEGEFFFSADEIGERAVDIAEAVCIELSQRYDDFTE